MGQEPGGITCSLQRRIPNPHALLQRCGLQPACRDSNDRRASMSTYLLLPSSSKGSKDGVCMTITSIPILRCKSKRLQQVIPTSLASGGMGMGERGWDGCVARARGPFLLAFGVYHRWLVGLSVKQAGRDVS